MLWIYGLYKYFILPVRGSILDFRIWRLQTSDFKFNPRAVRAKHDHNLFKSIWLTDQIIVMWDGMCNHQDLQIYGLKK